MCQFSQYIKNIGLAYVSLNSHPQPYAIQILISEIQFQREPQDLQQVGLIVSLGP